MPGYDIIIKKGSYFCCCYCNEILAIALVDIRLYDFVKSSDFDSPYKMGDRIGRCFVCHGMVGIEDFRLWKGENND